jgi:hypothetical protein
MDYRSEAPELIKEFLSIMRWSRSLAKNGGRVFLDLRTFIRFIKQKRNIS